MVKTQNRRHYRVGIRLMHSYNYFIHISMHIYLIWNIIISIVLSFCHRLIWFWNIQYKSLVVLFHSQPNAICLFRSAILLVYTFEKRFSLFFLFLCLSLSGFQEVWRLPLLVRGLVVRADVTSLLQLLQLVREGLELVI